MFDITFMYSAWITAVHLSFSGLPGRILNLRIATTLFSISLSWEPPGFHCNRRNVNYTYGVHWMYENKTSFMQTTTQRSIQLKQLSPNTSLTFAIWAICHCGRIGIPLFSTAKSKSVSHWRFHVETNTVLRGNSSLSKYFVKIQKEAPEKLICVRMYSH